MAIQVRRHSHPGFDMGRLARAPSLDTATPPVSLLCHWCITIYSMQAPNQQQGQSP